MPHKYYHGRTGVVFNVTPRSIGVEVNKTVRHKQLAKRIHVRVEHVRPSKSRDDYLERREVNDKSRKEKTGAPTKRVPRQPRPGFFYNPRDNLKTITVNKFVYVI